VHPGLDGEVLGRQPEGVIAHRMQDMAPGAPVEVRDGVAERVVLQVADVRLAARIRQHLEHVGLLDVDVLVADLPRALARPDLLPLGLDRARVVTSVGHQSLQVTCGARRTIVA
jgi:hypothetical protein